MENRPSIYYPGNTVSPPHPGRKRREKVLNPDKLPEFEGKNMDDRSHKVCVVSKCVWCGYNPGQWFITCSACGNCQYCGMLDNVDPYRCFLCGNFMPEDARTENVRIRPSDANNITERPKPKGYNKGGSNATIGL